MVAPDNRAGRLYLSSGAPNGALDDGDALTVLWRLQIEVMTLRAVKYRRLMDVVATGARDLTKMRGMGIGLIFCSFRGELGVGAVTFDARRLVRLL